MRDFVHLLARRFPVHSIPLYANASGIIGSDTNNTPNTIVERGPDGSINIGPINAAGSLSGTNVAQSPLILTVSSTLTTSAGPCFCTAASGNQVQTLPPANGLTTAKSQEIWFIKTDSSTNTVEILCAGSDTITGIFGGSLQNAVSSITLTTQGQTLRLRSSGSAWYIS